jgi:hypothetical protein
MKTALLGFFGDYESAELARAKLLVSRFPIDRITLTAVQGPGQSRMRSTPAALDTILSSLRALFKHDRDSSRAERLADRVERGAATVSAYAHNSAAAAQVAAVFRDCGATDIVRDTRWTQGTEWTTGAHEAAWPSHLWPAT